jgi:hypothetical protein
MSDLPALLTPGAAAKLLAISVKQLRDLSTAGEIRFVNIGLGNKRPTRRYLPADIEDFIARRRSPDNRPTGRPNRGPTAFYEVVDFKGVREQLRAGRLAAKKKGRGK